MDDDAPVTIFEHDWQDPGAERRILEAMYCQLLDWIEPGDLLSTCVIGHNVIATLADRPLKTRPTQPARDQNEANSQAQLARGSTGFDDMDDDIPF